jgi:hypothetical protein
MRRSWIPSIVPNGHDETIFLVLDDFGRLGCAFPETDPGQADLEATIADFNVGPIQQSGSRRRLHASDRGLQTHRCGEADAYWADSCQTDGYRYVAIITDPRPDEPLHRRQAQMRREQSGRARDHFLESV